MTHDLILLTPGPTPVPPEVREALGRPAIHHRTSEFQGILKEAAAGLQRIFKTRQDVFILTSSGTGAMEAAVVNLLSPGDEALVIRGGKFGERWGEICQGYGIQVIPLDAAWGKPLDPAQVRQALVNRPNIQAVFSTLCETSTGVTYDIQAVAQAMGNSKALLVVDTISGLGSEPYDMDGWGVDVTVCGSQKGLMLPPGLGFIALSDRAWQAVEKSRSPKYYFSLQLAKKAWADTDTPFTPGTALIIGLLESLKLIEKAGGVDGLVSKHRAQSETIRKAIQALGLTLYPELSCASRGVTAVNVPPSVDGKELLKKLRKDHAIVMAGGQGKELSGKIFRIASMGAIGMEEIRAGLEALEKVLNVQTAT